MGPVSTLLRKDIRPLPSHYCLHPQTSNLIPETHFRPYPSIHIRSASPRSSCKVPERISGYIRTFDHLIWKLLSTHHLLASASHHEEVSVSETIKFAMITWNAIAAPICSPHLVVGASCRMQAASAPERTTANSVTVASANYWMTPVRSTLKGPRCSFMPPTPSKNRSQCRDLEERIRQNAPCHVALPAPFLRDLVVAAHVPVACREYVIFRKMIKLEPDCLGRQLMMGCFSNAELEVDHHMAYEYGRSMARSIKI